MGTSLQWWLKQQAEGGYGELSVFYIETWDEDGVRRLSDTQIEAT